MAYLGNAPARSFISFERQVFTIVNSQTAYTLSHSVTNENDIRLVINNIVQEPGSGKAYTASGTTLTLSAALTNGTDEMYCVFLGRATATNAPAAGSVTNTKISYPLAQSGAVVSSFNRTSSDGNILELQKDGTVVGSIGNKAANIFMTNNSSNNTGFKINPDAITPSTSTGTDRDNAIDLGASGAAYKDLYLGGGLLVGGTGSANKLDDYEEGTWTPTDASGAGLSISVTGTAKYVKIGNTVFFTVDQIIYPSTSDTSGAALGGLPFTNTGNNIGTHNLITSNSNAQEGLVVASASKIFFYAEQTLSNSTNANLSNVSIYGISGVYTI
jgi:hypothetical protein